MDIQRPHSVPQHTDRPPVQDSHRLWRSRSVAQRTASPLLCWPAWLIRDLGLLSLHLWSMPDIEQLPSGLPMAVSAALPGRAWARWTVRHGLPAVSVPHCQDALSQPRRLTGSLPASGPSGIAAVGGPEVSWLWLIKRVWFPLRVVWSRSRPAGCVVSACLLARWWPTAAAPAQTSAGIAWTCGDAPNAGRRVRPGRLTSATALRGASKRQGRRLTCPDAARPAPVPVLATGAASLGLSPWRRPGLII